MPRIQRSALVMFSAEAMYRLVNDIPAYPEFVPDCSAAEVIHSTPDAVTASLEISKGGLRKWFTTRNELQPNKAVIMNLVDGPFKTLTGGWTFHALDNKACKVELTLDFEFSNKMVELAFGKLFHHMANGMVKAFTERAKQVYGVTSS
ncbi:type II toxin-antitoxin system RatA family toxin [Algicola sagamiensis]|uniref:type II toxin-antitoxin system RatA family toxin n=1 Tax=Algicola sagamiensis TaxID=163869 RepID=UPI00035DEF63|nr:type II toxin-antitoxin system RatA family toxin [Algicola sagamiensis]